MFVFVYILKHRKHYFPKSPPYLLRKTIIFLKLLRLNYLIVVELICLGIVQWCILFMTRVTILKTSISGFLYYLS